MKSNNKILNEFGNILIENVYDNQLRFIMNSIKDLSQTEGYKNLFKDMNGIQKKEIEKYTKEILSGALFDFLNLLEENDEYKLIYGNTCDNQLDLNKISENLKAEPIIENGWIDRFSKYADERDK
ncbi:MULTISPECIES: hypothetical protein [Weeksellaceae]|uniref:Uncharacterized protein n=1 Tax=Bergeyella zoohelcum ATCC 43767 TaxID=883096 RepID=K1LVI8_9FLAO|nr:MULTISPECIES: hypothetical protein [Weeksellaceae]EKB54078.1 hypothetical protein HMPREF9699_02121 [Bergeyella zoohelcum ATCC 43767]CAI9429322.1 Type I site-specific deoxyribonuclease [Candidatus Ornithobacterium hominis]SUV48351.1 Uncharacterised protein [Bergeyella zoohelcum]